MPIYTTIDDVRGEERIDSRDLIEVANNIRADILGGDEVDQDAVELVHAIDGLESVGIEDWQYGAHLIREDCFEDYARELAENIGAIDPDANWPLNHIDWTAAADALKAGYLDVEFLDHTYLVRS